MVKAAKRRKNSASKALPRAYKPEELTLEDWQIGLRRQFGREQRLRIKNSGRAALFSDFEVTNPQTRNTYRVAIRGSAAGRNFCSCPDFAVNTLGTCKHIEFVLGKLGRNRQLRQALAEGFRPPYSELYLRYGLKREVAFRPGTEIPLRLKEIAARYFDHNGLLKPGMEQRVQGLLSAGAELRHEVRCYDDVIAFLAQLRDRAKLEERIDAAFPRGIESAAFAKLLKVTLYPYQRKGALFAARAGRALLADDMGLGKTIQAIAAVEILARTAGIERVLVVTPTSLKHQWKQEIEKFSQRDACVVEGLSPARHKQYAQPGFYKITNYDVLHRDIGAIAHWAPDVIVLDEAQRIKNWKTRAAQTVKRLPSQHAIVLTGTPLENRLEELHSIVEFVDRFRLGPAFRFIAEHQQTDDGGKVVGYRNLSSVAATLAPIMLRRTKNEVLKDLPERIDKYYFVPMTAEQKAIHDENKDIVARIVRKWRTYRFLSEADQLRMRVALQYMRMSCNSTYLCDKSSDYGLKAAEIDELVGEQQERGMKTVIFSQWLRSHELLSERLAKRGIGYVLFHGGVPGPQRKDLIAQFKDDPRCRVFLSTDAGGVGLNLQHASAVINMDQPWNPAVLEQRIGRVHRLGQRRPVHVAHFVAEGTIEHSMLNLLKFKKSLFAGVLDGGNDEVFLGGSRLSKFMESVEQATTAMPPAPPASESEANRATEEKPVPANSPPNTDAESGAASQAAEQSAAIAELIKLGRTFCDGLEKALAAGSPQNGSNGNSHGRPGDNGLVAHDPETGQPFLKLPLPSPAALQGLAHLLQTLSGTTRE